MGPLHGGRFTLLHATTSRNWASAYYGWVIFDGAPGETCFHHPVKYGENAYKAGESVFYKKNLQSLHKLVVLFEHVYSSYIMIL